MKLVLVVGTGSPKKYHKDPYMIEIFRNLPKKNGNGGVICLAVTLDHLGSLAELVGSSQIIPGDDICVYTCIYNIDIHILNENIL